MWQEEARVRFFDVEPGGEASIVAICRLMEEAAHSQTHALGLSIGQVREAQRMWVLTRFVLRVLRRPRLGEDLVAQTWVSDRTAGVRAYRDFRLLDGAGNPVAEAASLWLLLDLKSRRPVRLPEPVLAIRYPERVGEEAVGARDLEAPGEVTVEDSFPVRWNDLDENGHANNLRYIEWVVATVPPALRPGSALRGLEIQFVSEVLLGETVRSLAEERPDGAFLHRLSTASGKVLAIARTEWERRS